MSLRFAMLAVLNQESLTGYEISKQFASTVANVWSASHQQIYLELGKMSKLNLLNAILEKQSGKPDRKRYSLTPSGKKELSRLAQQSPDFYKYQDSLMVKLFAYSATDKPKLLKDISDRKELYRLRIEGYETLINTLGSKPKQIGRYLSLKRGLMGARDWVAWCNEAIEIIT